jgi:hypothetical protein
MTTTAVYQLNPFTGYKRGFGVRLLRDHGDDHQPIDAQVRSGDYFVMLATRLDQLSKETEDYAVKSKLEDFVSDLIYLQDAYTISRTKE